MKSLLQYSWPGNVRELENVIERAVVLARKDFIDKEDIPEDIMMSVEKIFSSEDTLKPLKELEFESIQRAIEAFNGNKSKAARALGITRKVLYSRLRQRTK